MQTIFENEDERSNSGRTNTLDTIIYAGRIGRYMKEEFIRRFGNKRSRIQVSREIFVGIKKIIWKRR